MLVSSEGFRGGEFVKRLDTREAFLIKLIKKQLSPIARVVRKI